MYRMKFIYSEAVESRRMRYFRYIAKELYILGCFISTHQSWINAVLHNSFHKKQISKTFLRKKIHSNIEDIVYINHSPAAIIVFIRLLLLYFLHEKAFNSYIIEMVSKRVGGELVIFCDGHLSGFILSNACIGLNKRSYTLCHALYRGDDNGSKMMINNCTSTIYISDEYTAKEFQKLGKGSFVSRCSNYMTDVNARDLAAPRKTILICPPYCLQSTEAWVSVVRKMEKTTGYQFIFSLHPRNKKMFPDEKVVSLVDLDFRPDFAICGDSSVIIDCLSFNIPIVTVGLRPLSKVHIEQNHLSFLYGNELRNLSRRAEESLAHDRLSYSIPS